MRAETRHNVRLVIQLERERAAGMPPPPPKPDTAERVFRIAHPPMAPEERAALVSEVMRRTR